MKEMTADALSLYLKGHLLGISLWVPYNRGLRCFLSTDCIVIHETQVATTLLGAQPETISVVLTSEPFPYLQA